MKNALKNNSSGNKYTKIKQEKGQDYTVVVQPFCNIIENIP